MNKNIREEVLKLNVKDFTSRTDLSAEKLTLLETHNTNHTLQSRSYSHGF